jgi:hypothetical protein
VKWQTLLIAALAACLIWFGTAIVRLENERYANALDYCKGWDTTRSDITA